MPHNDYSLSKKICPRCSVPRLDHEFPYVGINMNSVRQANICIQCITQIVIAWDFQDDDAELELFKDSVE